MSGAGTYKVDGGASRIEDVLAQAPLYSSPTSTFKVVNGGLTPSAHVGKVISVSSLQRGSNPLGSPLSRIFRVTANGADSLTVAGDARNVGTPLPDSAMFSKYAGAMATVGSNSYQIVDSDDTLNEITVVGDASGESPDATIDIAWDEVYQDEVDGTPIVYTPGSDTSVVDLTTGGWGTDWFVGVNLMFTGAHNSYEIVSNTSSSITVKGDASGEGMSATVQVKISLRRETTIFTTPVFGDPNSTIELALNTSPSFNADLPQVVIPASSAVLDVISGTPAFNDPTSDIVLVTGGLTPDAHIGEFAVVGSNVYTITGNIAGTLTVMGDASGETGGPDVGIAPSPVVQFALTQLQNDQNGAEFAAEQVIELYDGTYTENVMVEDKGLEMVLLPLEQSRLKIQAATGESAVVLRNNGLSGYAVVHLGDVMNVSLEGVKIENNSETGPRGIRALTNLGHGMTIRDCVLEWTGSVTPGNGIRPSGHGDLLVEDSTFSGFADGVWHGGVYRRCTFRGVSVSMVVGHDHFATMRFESCLFEKSMFLFLGSPYAKSFSLNPATFLHCVWYDVATPFYWDTGAPGPFTYHRAVLCVKNCIFHTVSGTVVGVNNPAGRMDWSFNCFYNCTKIGFIDGVSYTTLADWKTFVDGEGYPPGDGSIESDPLFTNPASGDFTLQDGSPCHARCIPLGALEDMDGNRYRMPRCAMGIFRGNRTRVY